MGYYMGDYYRGDYYRGFRGDPGFWSTLGGIAKGVVGAIPGVGPVLSGVLGGVTGALATKGTAAVAAPAAAGVLTATAKPGALKSIAGSASAIVKAHPVLTAAGAAGIVGAAAGAGGMKMLRGHPAANGMRRRRRMRVTNVKALRRAVRRATGFAKLAKKVLSFTERRPHRGRAVFRKPRRAKRM